MASQTEAAAINPMEIESGEKRKEPCVSSPSVDLTQDVDGINFEEILIAGAVTPLKALSRDAELLASMNSQITIQVSQDLSTSVRAPLTLKLATDMDPCC